MEKYAPRLIQKTNRIVVHPSVIQELDDGHLIKQRVGRLWARESKHPFSIHRALRPALRHMGLHHFKVKGGVSFITPIEPRPIDPRQSIELIRKVLLFLEEHPGCKRRQLIEHLCPESCEGSDEVADIVNTLRWLIDRGHVMEFFDGSLAIPRGKRKKSYWLLVIGGWGETREAIPVNYQPFPVNH